MYNLHEDETQINSYLDRVARRLRQMPKGERDQEILEARQHIDELIVASEVSGKSREEVVRDALTQYGNPSVIGSEIARSWRRGVERKLPGTFGSAIGWCAAASFLSYTAHSAFYMLVPFDYTPVHNPVLTILRFYGVGLLLAFLNAFVAGIKAPRYALQGAAAVWSMWMAHKLTEFFTITVQALPAYTDRIFFSIIVINSVVLLAYLLGAHAGRRVSISRVQRAHRA